jgi:hypothetical protein
MGSPYRQAADRAAIAHGSRVTNGYLFSMPDVRMVRLLTTYDVFEAKLLAARLGSEGILWELRGGVDNAYPLGPVHVYVDEADLSVAHEVLAPVVDDDPDTEPELDAPSPLRRSPLALVGSVVVVGLLVVLSVARLIVMLTGP